MSELIGTKRKEALKAILRRLHAGESPDAVKAAFREAVGNVTPMEIAQLEEELVREGIPRAEIQRLCDVHLALFRESLERTAPLAPPWHPVHILMEEHKELLGMANRLAALVRKEPETEEDREERERLLAHTKESESHYLREENVLFPYLERHGVTEPPAVMWSEHQRIRELKKAILRHAAEAERPRARARLAEVAVAMAEMLAGHFYKENHILFPTALQVIPEGEWRGIRAQFDEIGYCCFTPAVPAAPAAEQGATPGAREERVSFPTGNMSFEELEAVLNTLPVDITFVDKDDTVRYFNQSKDRIFVRTPAVIGRKVQNCHPQKSVHVVERIVGEFREGRRDVAEFWIPVQGKLVYIRYFPVRGKDGQYLGTLEVTQEITGVKRIEGERRLLDEPRAKP
ncbi:MAG: DUF438 domain-containing protein [Candidatus Acetothermia bacterium]|jgi:PAS domain S-box-containing protein|nr:DUF438 domain-containing protein [Candidatus Acetothermia bacterium]